MYICGKHFSLALKERFYWKDVIPALWVPCLSVALTTSKTTSWHSVFLGHSDAKNRWGCSTLWMLLPDTANMDLMGWEFGDSPASRRHVLLSLYGEHYTVCSNNTTAVVFTLLFNQATWIFLKRAAEIGVKKLGTSQQFFWRLMPCETSSPSIWLQKINTFFHEYYCP